MEKLCLALRAQARNGETMNISENRYSLFPSSQMIPTQRMIVLFYDIFRVAYRTPDTRAVDAYLLDEAVLRFLH